jgi:hypothetical protein
MAGAVNQAVTREYLQIIRRPSGQQLACFSACNARTCLAWQGCHADVPGGGGCPWSTGVLTCHMSCGASAHDLARGNIHRQLSPRRVAAGGAMTRARTVARSVAPLDSTLPGEFARYALNYDVYRIIGTPRT